LVRGRQEKTVHAHRYRIIVCGRLGQVYWEAFSGLQVKPSGAYTTLTGDLDQAALHGVLDRILALALELVEITRLPSPATDGWIESQTA
jgi:hypothetical protein